MAVATLAVVPSARASVVDQSQPTLSNAAIFVSEVIHGAQTFTAGTTGSLDRVDLAISRPAAITVPLTVEIRATAGGTPTGPALASENVVAADIPLVFIADGFISVPLSPAAAVVAGSEYAIVLSSPGCGFGNCYHWVLGPAGDPYPAGAGLQSFDAGATWTPFAYFGSTDLAFKTYVARPDVSVRFLRPLEQSTEDAIVLNVGKNGRSVPIKFDLFDSTTPITGGDTPPPNVTIGVAHMATCAGAVTDGVVEYADAGQSSGNSNEAIWDTATQHWTYVLDTKNIRFDDASGLTTGECYRISVYLSGTELTNAFAVFKATK
jgi:hypothetical protein